MRNPPAIPCTTNSIGFSPHNYPNPPPCRRIVFEDQKAPCDVGGRWDKAVRYPEALRNNFSPAHCTTPPHCSPAPHRHAQYTGSEMLRLGSMAAIDIAQPNGLQRAQSSGNAQSTSGCPDTTRSMSSMFHAKCTQLSATALQLHALNRTWHSISPKQHPNNIPFVTQMWPRMHITLSRSCRGSNICPTDKKTGQ